MKQEKTFLKLKCKLIVIHLASTINSNQDDKPFLCFSNQFSVLLCMWFWTNLSVDSYMHCNTHKMFCTSIEYAFAPFDSNTNSLHRYIKCRVTIQSADSTNRWQATLTDWLWLNSLWGKLYKCNDRQIIHLIWTHWLNQTTQTIKNWKKKIINRMQVWG